MRSSFLVFLVGLFCVVAPAVRADAPEQSPLHPFRGGAVLEGFRSEIPLSLSDVDGVDWQGNAIIGEETQDPDENADYSTIRNYTGLKLFLEYPGIKDLVIVGFFRAGQVREIYRGEHDPGSFFVKWGDNGENDTVSFVGGFLFGFGAQATYSIKKFRIGGEMALSFDSTSYKNQEWFKKRTDGSLSITTFEVRFGGGYSFGFVTPRVSLGFLVYSASGEFDQILHPAGKNSHFEASFSAWTPITFTLGADIPAGDRIFASIDILLFGEYALRLAIGAKI